MAAILDLCKLVDLYLDAKQKNSEFGRECVNNKSY